MPDQGDEELPATPRSDRADRAEAVATLVALVWVSTVAIVFAVYGGNISLVGFLAIAPFIAAAFARPSRVAVVGLLAAFFALVISAPPHSYGELNHTLRVVDPAGGHCGGDVDLVPARSAQRPAVDGPVRDAERATAPRGGRDGPADAGHGPGPDHGGRPGPGGRRRVRRPARRAPRRRGHLCPARRAGPAADAPPLRLRPRRADRRGADRASTRRPRAGRERGLLRRIARRPAAAAARHLCLARRRAGSERWPSSRSSCPTAPSGPSSSTGTTTATSPSPTGASSSPSPARRPRPSNGRA